MTSNKKSSESKIERMLTKNLLEGIPTITSWIFSFLFEIGTATTDIFLSPSYYSYHDKSSSFIDFSSLKKKQKKIKAITIRQSIRRLKKQGFVEEKNGHYFLTVRGKLLGHKILEIKKCLNKKWDGKFRLVIFDIPEKNKLDRNWLRRELYILKYKLLQKSVFVGKQPLPKGLIKSIKNRRLGNYVNYILAEKIYKNIL